MSKALKSRGFYFVGPTICYACLRAACLQAVGMVNNHTIKCCFRYDQIKATYRDPGAS